MAFNDLPLGFVSTPALTLDIKEVIGQNFLGLCQMAPANPNPVECRFGTRDNFTDEMAAYTHQLNGFLPTVPRSNGESEESIRPEHANRLAVFEPQIIKVCQDNNVIKCIEIAWAVAFHEARHWWQDSTFKDISEAIKLSDLPSSLGDRLQRNISQREKKTGECPEELLIEADAFLISRLGLESVRQAHARGIFQPALLVEVLTLNRKNINEYLSKNTGWK